MAWSPLTIVFSRARGLRGIGSAVIRAMPPASRWSHCGVVVEGGVVEALASRGVVWTRWDDFADRQSAWQTVALECPRAGDGRRWARHTIGQGYDWLALLAVPLRQRWDHAERWECSAHVAEACERAGKPIWRVPTPRRPMTPGHVESLIYAAGGRLIGSSG